MTVAAVFHPEYLAAGLEHFARLGVAQQQALAAGLLRLHQAPLVDDADLLVLHEPHYVDAVLRGTMPLAQSSYLPWSPALVTACKRMLGGQRLGAQLALAEGLCINIACGFHHAHPARGGGFCVFNGLALVAALEPKLRVVVLDCDEHGGDGTEAFAARLPNLNAISIFGSRFGVRGGVRSRAFDVTRDENGDANLGYLQALDQALELVLTASPDLVIFQASADTHIDDPRASLRLTTATLRLRDERVLSALKSARVPTLITLAGGYQRPEAVAELYLGTIRTAARIHV